MSDQPPLQFRRETTYCEACERGDHQNCGMQTWCECECEGPHGVYGWDAVEAVLKEPPA